MMGIVSSQVRPTGQQVVTSLSTTSITFPARVFRVNILGVGGGGGGSTTGGTGGSGGAGGDLAITTATVVPGVSYSIAVGAGGTAGGTTGGAGGSTQWNGSALASGGGGARSGILGGTTGSNTVSTRAKGGAGGAASTASAGGGGGAAGYTGNGGAGGSGSAAENGGAGSGGSGGGGSYGGSSDAAGAGGGVGLLGIGSNGTGGVGAGANGQPGTGGSGGASGSASPGSTSAPSTGGLYGGGGGGAELTGENGPGAQGALRFIWGFVENAQRTHDAIVPSDNFAFQSSAVSFTGYQSTLTTGASFLTVTPTSNDFGIQRTGLAVDGLSSRYLHMRWKRAAAGYNVFGSGGSEVFWWIANGHGFSESYKHFLPQQYWDGTNFINTTLDMHNPFIGGDDWATAESIFGIRVDFDSGLTAYHVERIELSPWNSPSWVNLSQDL